MSEYTDVEQIRQQPDISSETHDSVLYLLIQAASHAIDNFCHRPDGFQALAAGSETARTYTGSGTAVQRIDECVGVTLVEVKDSPTDSTYTAWAATDYLLARGDPERPDFNHTPYTLLLVDPSGDYSHFTSGQFSFRRGFRPDPDVGYRGAPTVRVTARWGYAASVPYEIEQACIVQVCRWLTRGGSSWADSVGSAEMGTLMFRQELDPDVKHILVGGRFIRPAVG